MLQAVLLELGFQALGRNHRRVRAAVEPTEDRVRGRGEKRSTDARLDVELEVRVVGGRKGDSPARTEGSRGNSERAFDRDVYRLRRELVEHFFETPAREERKADLGIEGKWNCPEKPGM